MTEQNEGKPASDPIAEAQARFDAISDFFPTEGWPFYVRGLAAGSVMPSQIYICISADDCAVAAIPCDLVSACKDNLTPLPSSTGPILFPSSEYEFFDAGVMIGLLRQYYARLKGHTP